MGGILTDARGRSTVDGLWACGEVASTGAHGANRLASNSLLEAVVFGARVAHDIASALPSAAPAAPYELPAAAASEGESASLEHRLRLTMSEEVGVIRDERALLKALGTIAALERDNIDRRLANMLTTAKLVTVAALQRKESRGAHFRSDYPTQNDTFARRSFLTLAEAEAVAREATGPGISAGRRHLHARAALHA
jgi:L-aspartate oxidase